MKVLWSPRARKALDAIAAYIRRDNPAAAADWVNKAYDATQKLRDFPTIGRIVPEINKAGIRELILGNYRIIYRAGTQHIKILTIRHSRQFLSSHTLQ